MQTYYKTVLATILQWQPRCEQAKSIHSLCSSFQGVYYESNWKTLSCKKMKLDSSFIPMQVPPDAKLMGQVFMGSSSSSGMGVLTNTWYGSLSENGKKKQK